MLKTGHKFYIEMYVTQRFTLPPFALLYLPVGTFPFEILVLLVFFLKVKKCYSMSGKPYGWCLVAARVTLSNQEYFLLNRVSS